MIALNLSQDQVTKIKFRAASMDMAARVLRDGGLSEAAKLVDQMVPVALRQVPREVAHVSISIYAKDSDTIVRSTRRSGLRYVACLLRSSGSHDAAADHLDHCADMIPTVDDQTSSRRGAARTGGAHRGLGSSRGRGSSSRHWSR